MTKKSSMSNNIINYFLISGVSLSKKNIYTKHIKFFSNIQKIFSFNMSTTITVYYQIRLRIVLLNIMNNLLFALFLIQPSLPVEIYAILTVAKPNV